MAAMPEVKTQNVVAFVNFLQTPSQTEICDVKVTKKPILFLQEQMSVLSVVQILV